MTSDAAHGRRAIPSWEYESAARSGGARLPAGIDEAGRGPLAGPVVAAAVILPEGLVIQNLRDSKLLSPRLRDACFDRIMGSALSVGVGVLSHLDIDRMNILAATREAMIGAVRKLRLRPDHILIDGPIALEIDIAQTPIIKGDRHCMSIAAASVVAKVTRDRLMDRLHEDFPMYGFNKNRGYPTRLHREALATYGPCPVHRKSFAGVG